MLSASEGEKFVIIGGGLRVLIDGESSGGRCTVFDAPIPPGEGPPLHRHTNEDELFYVLDGRFKFSVDGKIFIGERGSFLCAPRGSRHAFRNIGKEPGQLLITCTPAGIEVPFRAVRIPDPASSQPPLSMEQMTEIFGRHGITFHGPPLAE